MNCIRNAMEIKDALRMLLGDNKDAFGNYWGYIRDVLGMLSRCRYIGDA